MADIHPFRALRYNLQRVSADQVVTQPYDKITPAMQERYYAASPYNLVRIILGRREPATMLRTTYTPVPPVSAGSGASEGILQHGRPAFNLRLHPDLHSPSGGNLSAEDLSPSAA